MTILEQKLKELAKLKQECIDLVINDENLSNYDKFKAIYETGIWEYDGYISDIFDEWEYECAQEEERLAIADGKVKGKDYISDITDCELISNYERYETIDYMNLITYSLDDSDESKILVATCRGHYHAKIYKTHKEITEYISKYAIENQSLGFKYDW